MKLIDGARCRAGYRGTAWRGMPDTETGLFTKKERNEENEKGNLEINSADHRHGAHCTLHITRSYELHVVYVEIKLFTKKLFELWVSK